MALLNGNGRRGNLEVIREGGYQPVSDPGPVPMELVRVDEGTLRLELANPRNRQIVGVLLEREASPDELARSLSMPLSTVSMVVAELARERVIQLVKTTQDRGAIRYFYRVPTALRFRIQVALRRIRTEPSIAT
jgi:hypothetical protein